MLRTTPFPLLYFSSFSIRKRLRSSDDHLTEDSPADVTSLSPEPPSSPLSPSPPPLIPPPSPSVLPPLLPPSPIRLSSFDLARKLTLSKTHLSLCGYKGYRTVRATHGIASPASLYFELLYKEVGSSTPPPAVRVGVCTAGADVDGCVGMDRWGYGVSSKGYRGHDGVWEEWEGGPWASGDIIGVWVQLGGDSTPTPPPSTPMDPTLSALLSQQQAAIFLLGSSLRFFRNGAPLGAAFSPLLRAAAYYPALSLYYGAEVEVNFGPEYRGGVPEEVHGGWWPVRGGEEGKRARMELGKRGVLHVGEGWEGGGLVLNPRHVQLEREKEKEKEEEEREKERRAKEREMRERLEKGKDKGEKRESAARRPSPTS